MPTVSVVMATYNGDAYVQEQLQSLFRQALLPAELLVGDDCSSDSTPSILKSELQDAPFPARALYRDERLGFADNFLTLTMEATADLVAFCDQDDIWYPEKLQRIVSAFNDPDVVLVVHHLDVVDAHGESLNRIFPRDRLQGDYGTNCPLGVYPGLAMAVRRELLSLIDYKERPEWGDKRSDRMGHDSWLWYVAPCFGKTVILGDRLAAYRQHHNLYGDAHLPAKQRIAAGGSSRFTNAAKWQERLAAYLTDLAENWDAAEQAERSRRARELSNRHLAYATFLRRRAAVYRATSVGAGARAWANLARTRSELTPKEHLRCIAKDGYSVRRLLPSPRRGRSSTS